MSRRALEIALAAGQDLMRRLDSLKSALEAGQDDIALDLASEIVGAKRRTPRRNEIVYQKNKSDIEDISDQSLLNNDDRLLRAKEARKHLGDLPQSTFYRYIKRGIIPKPRYMGNTPVWRLGDLRSTYSQLPANP
jgi:predicted DNA-binding transcriptional regulator AlpA